MKQVKYLSFIFLLFATISVKSQVAIGNATAAASSMLDITSTNKGLLIPRMTTANRVGIASPATGLMVYDSTLNQFFFYSGSAWTAFANNSNYWTLSGNNLYNNSGTQVGIGTTTSGETVADKLGVSGNIRMIGAADTVYIASSTTGNGGTLVLRAGNPY